jgi:glycopeptide antibiotics resistance protein
MVVDSGFALLMAVIAGLVFVLYMSQATVLPAGHLLAIALFLTYVATVASVTLFPIRLDEAYTSRTPFDPPVVLDVFLLGFDAMPPVQYIGNALLGLPFGLLAPFVWTKMSMRSVLVSALCFCVLVEALQWLTTKLLIAFPSRSADINDVLLNTLGSAVGVLAFLVLRRVYKRNAGNAVSQWRVWQHFHRKLSSQ